MDSRITFNLWTEPWIRIVWLNGAHSEVTIRECLEHAHEIHAFCDPSPLVIGGTQRLLAAILQAIFRPNDIDDVEALWARGHFDPAILNDFAQESAEYFDLFHPAYPFMQVYPSTAENDARDAKTVGTLFMEMPTSTNRTLYHHVHDESHAVCPACCARGLVTLPAFSTSGGSGIRPSINGVPPVYVFPNAHNLFTTLVLSILAPGLQPRKANPERESIVPWGPQAVTERNKQVGAPGYVESLLFPARWVRLFADDSPGMCTHCGQQAEQRINRIWYEMGHWLPKEIGLWDDPFVASSHSNKKTVEIIRPTAGKAIWREYSALLLAPDNQEIHRPAVVHQMAALMNRGEMLNSPQIRCVWVRTEKKAKIVEWGDESLETPPGILIHAEKKAFVDDAVDHASAIERILHETYSRHFSHRKQGRPAKNEIERFVSLRERMKESFWQRIEPLFRGFIRRLAEVEEPSDALSTWNNEIADVADDLFLKTAELIGSTGDALRRRVLAFDDFRAGMSKKRKEWGG